MKRRIVTNIHLMLFFLGLILIGGCANENINDMGNYNTGTIVSTNTGDIVIEEEIVIDEDQDKKDKVDSLRKKLALRGLILKGDINLENGEYTSALVKYLQIHKEIPKDESTINKIGDVYFNLQNFKQAYSYYSTIKNYDKLDKDKVVKTLFSFTPINDENTPYINSELDSLGLNEDQLFYYKNSISCIKDFSLCKQKFQEYFDEKIKKSKIIQGIGGAEKIPVFKELYNIETALKNYENFQIDDLSYKGALVSGAFFENGLYPIAIETAKILLKQKEDYKPLIKLISKSYYELGNFVEAKLYLIEYNKLVPKDAEASYFLGVVYEKLHEYVLSNIHFKKALSIGHTAVLDINKRILFNYYELGEIEKMLEIMKTIIKDYKDELTVNDFNIAIYYHIINDDINDAKKFAELALEKFADSSILNGYYGWILMEEINSKAVKIDNKGKINNIENTGSIENEKNIYSEAETYINKGLDLDTNSPMLNLVKGKLEINKGDKTKAFMYFKKTIAVDNNGDFGKIAAQELENIQMNK